MGRTMQTARRVIRPEQIVRRVIGIRYKTKVLGSHPTYSVMVEKAVSELKEKGGSSRIAILKFILANFHLGDNVTKVNAHLRTALKSGVTKGDLKQVSGIGASGSFKLGGKKTVSPKKVAKKTTTEKKAKSPMKKTAVKKAKAASTKTPTVKTTAKPKKIAAPKKAVAAKV